MFALTKLAFLAATHSVSSLRLRLRMERMESDPADPVRLNKAREYIANRNNGKGGGKGKGGLSGIGKKRLPKIDFEIPNDIITAAQLKNFTLDHIASFRGKMVPEKVMKDVFGLEVVDFVEIFAGYLIEDFKILGEAGDFLPHVSDGSVKMLEKDPALFTGVSIPAQYSQSAISSPPFNLSLKVLKEKIDFKGRKLTECIEIGGIGNFYPKDTPVIILQTSNDREFADKDAWESSSHAKVGFGTGIPLEHLKKFIDFDSKKVKKDFDIIKGVKKYAGTPVVLQTIDGVDITSEEAWDSAKYAKVGFEKILDFKTKLTNPRITESEIVYDTSLSLNKHKESDLDIAINGDELVSRETLRMYTELFCLRLVGCGFALENVIAAIKSSPSMYEQRKLHQNQKAQQKKDENIESQAMYAAEQQKDAAEQQKKIDDALKKKEETDRLKKVLDIDQAYVRQACANRKFNPESNEPYMIETNGYHCPKCLKTWEIGVNMPNGGICDKCKVILEDNIHIPAPEHSNPGIQVHKPDHHCHCPVCKRSWRAGDPTTPHGEICDRPTCNGVQLQGGLL